MLLRPSEPHRSEPHGVSRIAFTVAGLAALALFVLTLAVLSHLSVLQRVDAAISGSAHRFTLAHPLWRTTMSAITRTGSTTYLSPVASVACLALLRWRRWRLAVFVAVASLVTIGIRVLIVVNVARPRPTDWLTPASGWSFPSGHSTAAAATALIAVLVGWSVLHRRRDRLLLAGIAAAWAIAVGVSRVALTVHWPSDVLGAWLLVVAVVPVLAAGLGVLPAIPLDPPHSPGD